MGLNPVELAALAKKNPLVYGINYVDLLDGKQWDLETRAWSIEPYLACNPYLIENSPISQARTMAITKSTQAGISTMSIVKALHFMDFWSVRVGYMLPRQKDISDFSATRLDPVLENSLYLKAKKGEPDSVYTKAFSNSYLFFLEGSVEPRSMPMDALYLDEVDLCDPAHVGTAINRMDASKWKMLTYLSTPTLPAFGIDAVFETSDQREWIVPCPHCGHKQFMDWDKHMRLKGSPADPERVWYACEHCDWEITVQDMQAGSWEAQFPSRSKDIIGYHISQIYTTDAYQLYKHFRDPNQALAEFYRKRLGRPFTMAGGSLEREDFLVNCFNEPYTMEFMPDGKSTYYMGVDQGNQLQLIVAKIPPGKKNPKVVHIELVPFEEGFEKVGKLMKIYKVKKAVIDGDPNRHSVKNLQRDFPGKILMADYVDQRERYVVKNTGKTPSHVTVNRTEAFDDLVDAIRKGWVSLPGEPPAIPPQVEILMDQMTSIKRDIEKRKTLAGGEEDVAVWRKLRADHLAHAMLYLKTAIDSDQGRGFRIAIIGGNYSSQ